MNNVRGCRGKRACSAFSFWEGREVEGVGVVATGGGEGVGGGGEEGAIVRAGGGAKGESRMWVDIQRKREVGDVAVTVEWRGVLEIFL